VLASIRGITGDCAVAVMNMDVVLWKGDHLGAIVRCGSQHCDGTGFLLKYCYVC